MYKIKNVLDYRYRMIPTKEEYDGMTIGSPTLSYDDILPITTENRVVVGDSIYEMTLGNSYTAAIYDNKLQGWVIGTLEAEFNDNVAGSIGISGDKYALYELVGLLLLRRFSGFVMPSKFIYPTLQVIDGKAYQLNDIDTSNGVLVDEQSKMWVYNYSPQPISAKFYLAISRIIEPLYPKFVYEFGKYAGISDEITGLPQTIDDLVSHLRYMREGIHIDGTTTMKSANTPEIEQDISPEETINKYISSLFTTKNNKEDNITETMKHLEEMVDRLVSTVAYACFIPN